VCVPFVLVVMRKVKVGDESEEEEDEKRPANAPLVKVKGVMQIQLSPEASARRCSSKGRGTIYNSVFGICCHFCRYKIHPATVLFFLLAHLNCYVNYFIEGHGNSWKWVMGYIR